MPPETKHLVNITGNNNHKYISIPIETLSEKHLITSAGSGDAAPARLCNNSSSSGIIKLPVRPFNEVGGYVRTGSAVCTVPGRPEGATSSLGTVDRVSDTSHQIGYSSLLKMDDLKFDDPLMEYYNLAEKFCNYLKDCQDRNICVSGYNYKSGKMVTANLDYDNRWNANTRRKLSRRLDNLEYWFDLQQGRPVTLISLTSDHAGSIRQQWDRLNCSRTLLLKLIRKYFGDVDYFWVVEPQKSGYAHYHLAVFADVSNDTKDKFYEGIEDKFRRLWSQKYKVGSHTYGLDFVHRLGTNPLTKLKDYLTKYLRKGFALDNWTPAVLVFNTLLWETGYRLYGASKRLSGIMKIEPQPHKDTVWLKTEITTADGETYTHRGRLYIPEWLDSDFWLTSDGQLLPGDPPPKYIHDWGRPASYHPAVSVVHQWVSRGIFRDVVPS